MSEASSSVPGPRGERRAAGEQRRYNRRSPVSDVSPPYYEIFDRIALALEGVERALTDLVERGVPRSGSRTSGPPTPRDEDRG